MLICAKERWELWLVLNNVEFTFTNYVVDKFVMNMEIDTRNEGGLVKRSK